jgi:hypothetical protein
MSHRHHGATRVTGSHEWPLEAYQAGALGDAVAGGDSYQSIGTADYGPGALCAAAPAAIPLTAGLSRNVGSRLGGIAEYGA